MSRTALEPTTRQLLFLTTPALWSTWPFLPLVRRTGAEEEHGLLFDPMGELSKTGLSTTVFLANLFLLPPTLEEFLALPKEVYDEADKLLDAGWSVD
ncbi:MAG: hypothetical protein U0791_25300 [Gemmataceae bacterium]